MGLLISELVQSGKLCCSNCLSRSAEKSSVWYIPVVYSYCKMAVRSASSRVIKTDFLDDVYEYSWPGANQKPAGAEEKSEKKPKARKPVYDMPVTSCAVCGGSENEDQVLLCDGEDCSNEIHIYCLQVTSCMQEQLHQQPTSLNVCIFSCA